MTTLQTMISKTNAVRKNAYAPISHFLVGTCLRTPENQFFVGCNIENASFSMTICAESAAIANMVSNGGKQIAEMVIIAETVAICPPCGACRQRIVEFSTPKTMIHLCSKEGIVHQSMKITELFPMPFHVEQIKDLYVF